MEIQKQPSFVSGALLLAGTCMGAGMLALPVVTGPAGFFPGIVINAICWLFMMATGLLFLEATLWMHEGANVLSMAQRFLGRTGKWLGGLAFLFLYYCLLISYISGAAPLVKSELGLSLSVRTVCALFAGIFGLLVFWGTAVVDRINWLLMTAAIASFALLMIAGSSAIDEALLTRMNWKFFFLAAPTLFSAYGYHNLVPTLTFYMKRNSRSLRLAIFFGTLLPFIIYTLWQWMIIGSLPLELVQQAAETGVPITYTLQEITGHPWVSFLGGFFGIFAIITSLLGVALSMVDFLGDGMHMKRTGSQRLFLTLLVFIPSTLLAMENPGIFLVAIGVAGGYGEALLNGFFPICMVWMGRYHYKLGGERQLFGGRVMLSILLVITFFVVGLESYHLLMGG